MVRAAVYRGTTVPRYNHISYIIMLCYNKIMIMYVLHDDRLVTKARLS